LPAIWLIELYEVSGLGYVLHFFARITQLAKPLTKRNSWIGFPECILKLVAKSSFCFLQTKPEISCAREFNSLLGQLRNEHAHITSKHTLVTLSECHICLVIQAEALSPDLTRCSYIQAPRGNRKRRHSQFRSGMLPCHSIFQF